MFVCVVCVWCVCGVCGVCVVCVVCVCVECQPPWLHTTRLCGQQGVCLLLKFIKVVGVFFFFLNEKVNRIVSGISMQIFNAQFEARLKKPNICQLPFVFLDQGTLFIVLCKKILFLQG